MIIKIENQLTLKEMLEIQTAIDNLKKVASRDDTVKEAMRSIEKLWNDTVQSSYNPIIYTTPNIIPLISEPKWPKYPFEGPTC